MNCLVGKNYLEQMFVHKWTHKLQLSKGSDVNSLVNECMF